MKYDIKALTLEEKIGQMLMVGVDGNKITTRTINQIKKYKVGGIVLYKKNFNNYEEMINLIQSIKELNKKNKIPLFIAVDQEGGRVNRMPKEILNIPAPYKIVNALGEEGIKKSALITSEILNKSGYNLNFAPNLDINRFEKNQKVVGDRSFGENKDIITKMGIIQMNIFKENDIIPVIKHFPGHGATIKDSHYFSPKTKISFEELSKMDLKPFENAIQNGADCVLIGHLRIKGENNYTPCSLSRKFIIKNLRKKLHYRGLIITDDLKMRAIQNIYGYEHAAIKAIKAGNDIIMFRYNETQESKTINKILDEVKNGKINIYKINSSVKRILKIKEKYNITDNTTKEKLDIKYINEKILDIRDKVLNN